MIRVPRLSFVLNALCRSSNSKLRNVSVCVCSKNRTQRQSLFRTYASESILREGKPLNNGSSSSSSSSSSDDSEEWDSDSQESEEQQLKTRILQAALPFVKECGWTSDAIARGAESLGYSGMVHGMFENGAVDLVNHFFYSCNVRLEKELQNLLENQEGARKRISTTEFIRTAVEIRLRMNADYLDSWAKALVLQASPSNLRTYIHNFGTMIDTIWYYAGDKSTDFNWYSKRVPLGVIYKSTEYCMLQDSSQDFQETWAFLDRRLQEVTAIAKCVKQTGERTEGAKNFFEVGCITAQNILGLNSKSRN